MHFQYFLQKTQGLRQMIGFAVVYFFPPAGTFEGFSQTAEHYMNYSYVSVKPFASYYNEEP